MRLKIVFAFLSRLPMTDVASTDDSATNLSAFNLGVFSNQLLWNLDQAVLARSERHRIAALGLVQRLQAIGADFTEMRTDEPLQVALSEIRKELPENVSQSRGEWLDDMLSSGRDPSDDSSDGEWWYSHFGVGRERESLRRVIVDSTLHTPQQRLWFELGALIDSGRHRPDTGYHVYRFNPWLVGPLPATTNPQSIEAINDGPESPLPIGNLPAAEQGPQLRTFEPGELPPRQEWWLGLTHLCEGLRVPCNPEPPDLSTSSSIIDTAENLIERVQVALGASRTDANVPTVVGPPSVTPAQMGGIAGPDAVTSSIHSNPKPNEVIGNWKFFDAEVQYADFNTFIITQPYHGTMHCLLKDRINKNWKHLAAAGWGEGNTKIAKDITTTICRLRKTIRENIEPSFVTVKQTASAG